MSVAVFEMRAQPRVDQVTPPVGNIALKLFSDRADRLVRERQAATVIVGRCQIKVDATSDVRCE